MATTFIGNGFPKNVEYGPEERRSWQIIKEQINAKFPNDRNLLISLTWFGPQFDNNEWQKILDFEAQNVVFDNLFLLATVDPPYLNVTELQLIKNKIKALRVFYLGNFDSPHQFNFFAPIIGKNFIKYNTDDLILESVKNIFLNYNLKPKQHRIDFIKLLIEKDLLNSGIVTVGYKDLAEFKNNFNLLQNGPYSVYSNREGITGFDIPRGFYTLHNMNIWRNTFLYINAATEFNPVNDLFCQQDTFKPLIGMRPFVINGVQKTYRWLRLNGFKTFNHYWEHIDIENGDVHNTIVELITYLNSLSRQEILLMYNDMILDLKYNKERFFEFSKEQKYKMNNLFL
jgi:hypothetical protein